MQKKQFITWSTTTGARRNQQGLVRSPTERNRQQYHTVFNATKQ